MVNIYSKLVNLQNQKVNSNHWNVSWRLGFLLSNLIEIANPNNILEIGTSNGFSTLWMAKNIDEFSKIFTIEVNKSRFEIARNNFIGLNNIHSLNGEAFEVLNNFNFNLKFDFIFIDAGQKYYESLVLKLIEKDLISDICVLVFDNILTHDNMDDFISFMNLKFTCELIEMDSGFLVCKNKN